jgi:hypothetical protein
MCRRLRAAFHQGAISGQNVQKKLGLVLCQFCIPLKSNADDFGESGFASLNSSARVT